MDTQVGEMSSVSEDVTCYREHEAVKGTGMAEWGHCKWEYQARPQCVTFESSLKGGKCARVVVWGKSISDAGGERTGPGVGAVGRSQQPPAQPGPGAGSALGFYSRELTCLRAFEQRLTYLMKTLERWLAAVLRLE